MTQQKSPPRPHRTSEVQRELGGANFIGTQLSPPGPTANAVRTRGAQLINGGGGHGGNGGGGGGSGSGVEVVERRLRP